FQIHHRTGRISLKKKLDRELVDSYLLTVKVRDVLDLPPLASPSHLHALALNATPDWALVRTATTYVRVNVLDTNDNRPEFIATYDNLVVPADLPEGAYVTTLRARDADSGHNAVLQYSLFGGEADKMCFDCELTTGVVRIAPDCGGLRPGHVYSLTAWVCDLGTPDPLQTSSPFKVTVVDLRVNVWPPRFDAPNGLYEGKLLEGVPIGSKVMQIGGGQPLRVSASDPEDLPIVFRADGGSGLGIFTVSDDGFIISKRELVAMSSPFPGGYWVELYAEENQPTDRGLVATDGTVPGRAVAEVFIQIEDRNDNRPMPAAPEYRFHVTEGSPAQTIVATVTGEDRDSKGRHLHHAIILGDPNGHFVINPSTGQIATSAIPIDRESSFFDANGQSTDEVHLVIALTDSGSPPQSTEVHAIVVIDDLNDNAPRFLFTHSDCGGQGDASGDACYRFYHRLGDGVDARVCFGNVFAVDLDRGINGTVIYELADLNTDFFVDSITGEICSTGTPLQPSSNHTILVSARDSGVPSLSTANPTAVYISILPSLHEEASLAEGIEFVTAPPAKLAVSPGTPPGTILYQVELAQGALSTAHWTFSLKDLAATTPFAIATLSDRKAAVYLREWLNSTVNKTLHEVDVVASIASPVISRRTNIFINPSPKKPPVFDTSAITAGQHVTLEITDFRLEREESGASGVVVHLTVAESVLVGSVICSLTKPGPNPLEFAIVAAGNEASYSHFHFTKKLGRCKFRFHV
uniref:Cadherin domain-containing protein n=1 Tax=Mesocestoides corti TaxID=53468 RepID=A0A5K3EPZ1_MESCO